MFKPINPDSKITLVSVYDSAIDQDVTDWAKYGETIIKDPSKWREIVKIKDGETPTEFLCGVVPSEELVRIDDECSSGKLKELYWKCFLYGLRDLPNWVGEKPEKIKNQFGLEYVSPGWIKKIFIGRGLKIACDIGRLIYYFNQLSGEEIKN